MAQPGTQVNGVEARLARLEGIVEQMNERLSRLEGDVRELTREFRGEIRRLYFVLITMWVTIILAILLAPLK